VPLLLAQPSEPVGLRPYARMRICIAYDCLYPWTVGGLERYLRELAEAFAAAGHDVTYATRVQWDAGEDPSFGGVRVVGVSPREPLYDEDGRRVIGETLHYARGLAGHLLRERGRYDHVHLVSFPYFSLLSARAALAGTGTPVTVDWLEVWTWGYWREYLGAPKGTVGWLVERACALATPRAFTFSDLHGDRLRRSGMRGEAIRLAGMYTGPLTAEANGRGGEPLVVFAGRHIPEKRAATIPAAVALARREVPGLRAVIFGDGPERPRVLRAIEDAGAGGFVEAPGFVDGDLLRETMAKASVHVLPSRREGYGMVVVEAAAVGTPSVVVAAPDNAAVEQVSEGENGYVAASDEPEALAAAIVRAVRGGDALRDRTLAWFEREAPRRRVGASVATVLEAIGA
jgi:glycosyltransferase involved in cell wall biosynthesis